MQELSSRISAAPDVLPGLHAERVGLLPLRIMVNVLESGCAVAGLKA